MEKDVLNAMAQAERTSYEVSRRKAMGIAAKLGFGGAAAAALATCVGSRSVREAFAAGGLPQKPYKFTFVNHVTTNPFFTPTQYGIEDACAFFGCTSQWTGSQTSTVTEMVSAMETAIADKSDGIAVCLVDAEAFNKATDDALSIGIPVIAYNADTPNARLAYIGQTLYESGYNIAKKWLPMIPDGGKVMLSIATPGSLNLQPRLDGYIQAIKDDGDRITYEEIATGVDQPTQESTIESYYLANKDVVGFFGTGATDSLAVGKLSQKYGLAANGVITAGYDLLPETIALVGSGDMTFTTDQQPYLQGFIPTLQLYLYKLSGGAVSPANTDTSLAYVTKDNVDVYLAPSRFEGSSEDPPA